MKTFNFENYQKWFNDNFSPDYILDEGDFPEDGEIGMHENGYEIGQLVYSDGINVGDFDLALAVPGLGLEPNPNFIPSINIDTKLEEMIDISDLIYKTDVSVFHHKLILVPFLEKYITFFEEMAKGYTGLEPKQPLLYFLNN